MTTHTEYPYATRLDGVLQLNTRLGASAVFDQDIELLFARLQRGVNHAQHTLQTFMFEAHREEFLRAASALKQHLSTQKRLKFLLQHDFIQSDDSLTRVFRYCAELFARVIEFRHLVAHSMWMTCDQYPDRLIVSELANEVSLLLAKARVNSDAEMTAQATFEAIVRYNSSLYSISREQFSRAVDDLNLATLGFMQVNQVVGSPPDVGAEIIRGFKVFKGFSHLFSEGDRSTNPVSENWRTERTITG